jgi:hypothetical protein
MNTDKEFRFALTLPSPLGRGFFYLYYNYPSLCFHDKKLGLVKTVRHAANNEIRPRISRISRMGIASANIRAIREIRGKNRYPKGEMLTDCRSTNTISAFQSPRFEVSHGYSMWLRLKPRQVNLCPSVALIRFRA